MTQSPKNIVFKKKKVLLSFMGSGPVRVSELLPDGFETLPASCELLPAGLGGGLDDLDLPTFSGTFGEDSR